MGDKKIENIRKPQIFRGGTSGDIIFFNNGELLRITEEGDVYIQEELKFNNRDLYVILDEWFKTEPQDEPVQ